MVVSVKLQSSGMGKRIYFSEDVGSRLLQNVGTYLPNYMASHPRRS
jgi:hypothetical protein